jgi:hypothetical protein
MNGDESWAVAYENGESETQQQTVEVDIEQVQLIEQLNVNEQFGAIAFATARGESVAEQLNFQVNENVQMAEATAVNVRNDGNQKDGIKNDSKTTDIMP